MRRLAIVPLLLTAAACGADARPTAVLGGGQAEPVTTRPATEAPAAKPPVAKPPVAKPPVTQPPAAKPPVAKPPAAKPPAPPAAPPASPAARGDVDGDGRADAVRIAESRDSLATGRWELRATLAAGGTVTGVVIAEPRVRPEVLGVTDADKDGDGEVFVRVGGGASTTTYTPFALVEDGLAEVRTNDGKALQLVVGGTVTHSDGFACADVASAPGRELVVRGAADGRGTQVVYRWRADRVEVLSRTTVTSASDTIECDDL